MPEPKAEVLVAGQNEREVFIGPRPFERSEYKLFFGRDREISELLSLVTSNRVVLCYAPSGAGKTSLINAGLQPRLETEGFEVLPSTRVRGLIPEGVDQSAVANIYAFNAILSLAKETGSPAELTSCTISEYLATLPHLTDKEDFPSPRILIFDQFEELLTSYLERWQEREGFFQQVRDALQADPLLRVLFVMREDFVARIEPFMRILKPLQQTRFRLDLLGPTGAHAAVTGPLRGTHRHFKDGVVDSLVEELLKVRVESTQGEATEVIGEYVEPVQLQVVCRNLWTSLPEDVQEISHEHLKAYGDVDHALRDFYESCLSGARTSLHANEKELRQWFERQLITPAGTRSIVFRDARQTAGLPNAVVDFLENRHIIRGEWRAGSRWYELTHDRLIEPIQRANEAWRVRRQARTSRLLITTAGIVVLALILFSVTLSLQQSAFSGPQSAYTQSASTVVAVQTVAQEQVADAQENVAISQSRQLAAQALLTDDLELARLLAVQANQFYDTPESRQSLHQILSRQGIIDGEFLQAFNPDIISPTLVKSLNDHQGSVVSVAFSPDAQRFVSGSGNGSVLLWDVVTAKPIGPSLTTRGSGVESVAYSPDGLLVASTGQDEQISLWNAITGEPVGTPLSGHEGLVTSLDFSPDGKLLASGGMDFQIRIWDVSSGRLVEELKADDTVASLAWSPDGQILAVGTFDQTVSFWINEGDFWNPVDRLSGLGNPVRSIAWSPDGKLLAFGLGSDDNAPESGDVILWDYENRQRIAYPIPDATQWVKPVAFHPAGEMPAGAGDEPIPPDRTQRVRTVVFHPAGKILAIGRDDGKITFWDIQREQILGSPLEAHDHWVMSIAFSPDGRYLLSGSLDGTVALWNLLAPSRSVAVSPNGDLLASSQGSIISLWDVSAGQTDTVKILSGHAADILALTFSPDGNTLVSSGKDNSIRFWDVREGLLIGAPISTISNVPTLQFSPDGSRLAVAGESGRVQLFDPVTGELHTLLEQPEPVLRVQFGEDGKTLQAVSQDGTLFIWELTSNNPQTVSLPGTQGGITSVAFSPSSRKIAYFREGGIGETISLSNDGRAHGIELLYWNQSFDPTVNQDDIDFIVVKATEGTHYVDPTLDKYLKEIQSVPIRGAYHFFRENQPWKEQADLFLSTVNGKGFHFYVLYLEVNPQDGSTEFLADAEQWLKYVDNQVEGRVLLGTGSPFLSKFGAAGQWMKDWPLLFWHYSDTPDRNGSPFLPEGFNDWKIWNYSDTGNNAEYGIGGGNVFLEVYNGTPLEMAAWLGINAFTIYDPESGTSMNPKEAIQVSSPNGLAFSPDGSYLAAAGAGTVSLLEPTSGEAISSLSIGGQIFSLVFTPDSNALVIGTDYGTVLLWDLSLLKPETDPERMLAIACSRVQDNFSDSQWGQYVGDDVAYNVTCLNAPVP